MEKQGEGRGEGGRGNRMQSAALLTLSKVILKGCSVVRVDLLGQWWRRGSAELDGRLEGQIVEISNKN